MKNEFLNNLKKKIILSSPIILIFTFFIVDTFPFYIIENLSIKSQLTITCIYSWIVISYERIRPFIILFFSFLFDVFNNLIFGISPLILLLVFMFQKQDNEFLASAIFKNTWIKFIIFNICYNLLTIGLQKFLFTNTILFFPETIISMVTSILFFPAIFLVANFLNEKIKDHDE